MIVVSEQALEVLLKSAAKYHDIGLLDFLLKNVENAPQAFEDFVDENYLGPYMNSLRPVLQEGGRSSDIKPEGIEFVEFLLANMKVTVKTHALLGRALEEFIQYQDKPLFQLLWCHFDCSSMSSGKKNRYLKLAMEKCNIELIRIIDPDPKLSESIKLLIEEYRRILNQYLPDSFKQPSSRKLGFEFDNKIKIINFLLDHAQTPDLAEALSLAVKNAQGLYGKNILDQYIRIIKVLLNHGADPLGAGDVLLVAAMAQDRQLINSLLASGIKSSTSKALEYVGRIGETDIANLLLPTSHPDQLGDSLLMAARCGKTDFARFIVGQGAISITGGSTGSFGLLEEALLHDQLKTFEYLLQQDQLFGLQDYLSVMKFAVRLKVPRWEFIKILLLQKGVSDNLHEILTLAVEREYIAMIKLLLGQNPDLSRPDALLVAVCKGNLDIIRLLLEAGTALPVRALTLAITHRHNGIAQYLLNEKGIAPCPEALTSAMENRDAVMVNQLLASGVQPAPEALTVAIKNRDAVMVNQLLASGVQPAPEALTSALRMGNFKMVNYLLGEGIQPVPEALTELAKSGDAPMVGLLLDKGFQFSSQALLGAVCSRRSDVVELLFDKVCRQGDGLWAEALTKAIECKQLQIIEFLCQGKSSVAVDFIKYALRLWREDIGKCPANFNLYYVMDQHTRILKALLGGDGKQASDCLNYVIGFDHTEELTRNDSDISGTRNSVPPEPVEGCELRTHVLCQASFDSAQEERRPSSKCWNYLRTIPASHALFIRIAVLLLLEAGAEASPETLMFAVQLKDDVLVGKLMKQKLEIAPEILRCAIEQGEAQIVWTLLDGGARPTADALDCAIRRKHFSIIYSLLEAGAVLQTEQQTVLLNLVIKHQEEKLFSFLVKAGVNSVPDALEFAVECHDNDVVERLLKKGAKVTADILMLAAGAKGGRCWRTLEIMKLLLEYAAADLKTPAILQDALFVAVEHNCFRIVDFLIQSGTVATAHALNCAVKSGFTHLIEYLLNNGADPTDEALKFSVEFSNYQLFELLLAKKADLNAPGILKLAARNSDTKFLMRLLENGTISPFPNTLKLAAKQGYRKICQSLLFDWTDDQPSLAEALALAEQHGNQQICQCLSVYIREIDPVLQALMESVRENNREMCRLLLDEGGAPPTILAKLFNPPDWLVQLLLDSGAPLTPWCLKQAAIGGKHETCKKLLANGAAASMEVLQSAAQEFRRSNTNTEEADHLITCRHLVTHLTDINPVTEALKLAAEEGDDSLSLLLNKEFDQKSFECVKGLNEEIRAIQVENRDHHLPLLSFLQPRSLLRNTGLCIRNRLVQFMGNRQGRSSLQKAIPELRLPIVLTEYLTIWNEVPPTALEFSENINSNSGSVTV